MIFGTPGANGWYRTSVTVNWKIEADPGSPVLETIGCDAKTLSVDTPGTTLECRARNDPFDTPPYDWSVSTKTFKIDKTPPSASATADRAPDANGWFNRLLTVTASGTDATSGIAGCTSAQYAGPDSATALVPASCSDHAGNVTLTPFSFKYDATAPTITAVSTRRGNRSAQVAWRKSTDTQVVEVVRAPGRNGQGETLVYRGSETGFRDTGLFVGRKYEYRVIGVDEAANRAEQKVDLVATGALLNPTPGQRVASSSPPNLIWAPVKKASYYNVQLIHRGHKIFSTWPARPGFQLRRTWLYKGRRHRLRPGVYRWYVWAGYGPISAGRYGRRPIGSSTFVVTS